MLIGDRFRLDGRTVVVAGAGGGGIGTAVCVAAAELGANVVGIDVNADAIEGAPFDQPAFHGIVADVRDKAQVEAAMREGEERFGPVDGLVHVAGGQRPRHWQPVEDLALEDFDDVFDLNARAALVTSQAAAKAMMRVGRRGSIVHIASVTALFASPYSAAYGAAKASMLSLTRTMAVEWGARGIRVNAIGTGTIRTPKSRGGDIDNGERDAVLPLKRRGRPEEVAAAAAFLLSDLSSFVTGHTLVVDGGSSIRPSYLGPDNLPVFVEHGEIRRRLAQP
jgi:NAD(P)-dependent dehydrogenase (short-subunit alcohol dehydrogenase family)